MKLSGAMFLELKMLSAIQMMCSVFVSNAHFQVEHSENMKSSQVVFILEFVCKEEHAAGDPIAHNPYSEFLHNERPCECASGMKKGYDRLG